ncbi:MAG: hypothetical protein QG673_96 [Pseudomonadota bacterium]|jgi:phage/plasmid primase-like uncharacterized protein|nr:hypothetical protein [Pseudomonadota bacterium]HCY39527.1 hypothetical protein [Neisseriales bacterium]
MMLNIPTKKLAAAIDAMNAAGLIIDAAKLSNSVPDRKYRSGTQAKPTGLNGWYVIKYDSALDFITIVYGNFEHGDDHKLKYHINLKSHDQPIRTSEERKRLQEQIDAKIAADRAKQTQERQRKAAHYSAEFQRLPLCESHPYTDRKGIADIHYLQLHQDMRFNKNLLCIPFYDRGIIQGYQTIAPDGTKLFNGSIGGNYWQYPLTNPLPEVFTQANSFFIIGEGLATVLSAYQAIINTYRNIVFIPYMLVAFNCGNLDKVIKATQSQGLPYLLLVDNDSTKPRNAGIESAKRLIMDNPNAIICPMTFTNDCDANDFIIEHGEQGFIDLLIRQDPIMQKIGV